MNLMKEGSRILGREIDVTPKLKDWVIEAGYTDVVERRVLVPLVLAPPSQESKRFRSESMSLNTHILA